jgi:excisionase family DNA binding protein
MADSTDLQNLTITEAASVLRVSRSQAYALARRRTIPVVMIGHSVRVPRARLVAWLDARTDPGEPA